MTNHPTAQTPEGHRIGAGMAEWLHGVGHGPLDGDVAGEFSDGIFEAIDFPDPVCQHGRDDYCRPCLVRERKEERELGLDGGRFGWDAHDGMLGRLAE